MYSLVLLALSCVFSDVGLGLSRLISYQHGLSLGFGVVFAVYLVFFVRNVGFCLYLIFFVRYVGFVFTSRSWN